MGHEPSCVDRVHRPSRGTRKSSGGIDMMRKVALLLVLIVGMTNLPVLTVHAASPPANLAKALQQVAQLREAEAMIDRVAQKTQNHKLLRGLVTGADHRIDEAVKMLRRIAASLS